jgi:hypothetical protein
MMSRFSGEREVLVRRKEVHLIIIMCNMYIQRWCLHTCSANAYASTRNILDINTSEELNWRAEQQREDDHSRAAEGERSGMEEG